MIARHRVQEGRYRGVHRPRGFAWWYLIYAAAAGLGVCAGWWLVTR